MRTTLDLDDALYRQTKEAAAQSGRTMKDVVEDALRLALRPSAAEHASHVTLPESTAIPGVRLGVDLDNGGALLEH